MKSIESFMKARSGFAKVFKDAEKPMVIVGSGVFEREDGMAIHNALHTFAEKLKLVRDDWNGFNVFASCG